MDRARLHAPQLHQRTHHLRRHHHTSELRNLPEAQVGQLEHLAIGGSEGGGEVQAQAIWRCCSQWAKQAGFISTYGISSFIFFIISSLFFILIFNNLNQF